MQSKAVMTQRIKQYGDEIIEALRSEDAKIRPTHFDVPEDADGTTIKEGLDWLVGVYGSEYREIVRIKALQSSEIWARYKRWGGFEEHREVVLLRRAIHTLRMKVVSRDRPELFKKTKTHARTSHKVNAAQ